MASAFRSRPSAAARLSIHGSSLSWSTTFCRRTESVARGTTSSSLRISDPAGRRSLCWTVLCTRCRKTNFAWRHCDEVTLRLPEVPVRLSVPTKALGCGNTYLIQSIGYPSSTPGKKNGSVASPWKSSFRSRNSSEVMWPFDSLPCRNTRSWWPFNGFQLLVFVLSC